MNVFWKVIDIVVCEGVKYVEVDVKKVFFDKDGFVIGVIIEEGRVIYVLYIVLVIGVMIVNIFVDSVLMELKF